MTNEDEFDLVKLAEKSVRLMEALDTDEVPDPNQLYSLVKTQNRMIAGLIKTLSDQNSRAADASNALHDFAQSDSEFGRKLLEVLWRFITVAHERGVIGSEDVSHIVGAVDPVAEIEMYLMRFTQNRETDESD